MSDTRNTDRLPRIVLLTALAVALLSLALYLLTLHPGVGPSLDSMELQIAALVGGVIHPPGSPQYLMLGRLAMLALPGPNPAYRLNLMSALAAAATVGVAYLLTFRLTRNPAASLYASLALALATRFWYQANVAELYALNSLYVALVLYLLLSWHQTRRPAFYWSAIVVYALSFGNHASMILLLPAFLYTVEITDRSMLFRPSNFLLTGLIVVAAAAQYLYIPLRTMADPPFCNFCPSPQALPSYLTGGPFKFQFLALARREVLARLPESVGQWNTQFMPWGYALAIIGGWELFRRRAVEAWLLVLGLAAEYIFTVTYAIPDWHDFMTPCYVISAPLIGYGALTIWEFVEPQARRLALQGRMLAGYAYPAALSGLAALALLTSLYTNYPLVNQSDETAFDINGHALLRQAKPGAWLIMPRPSSHTFLYSWALRYISYAEKLPPDLIVITPPEVNPPPGPSPYYKSWAAAEPELSGQGLIDNTAQILVLDLTDDRFSDWGFLPICLEGETVVGYEVVAAKVDGEVIPRIDPTRWSAVEGYVLFDPSNEPHCP